MSDTLITLLARASLILALREREDEILDDEDSDSSVVVPCSVPSSVS